MHRRAKTTAKPKPTELAQRVKIPASAGCRDVLDAPKSVLVSLLLFILSDAKCAEAQRLPVSKSEIGKARAGEETTGVALQRGSAGERTVI